MAEMILPLKRTVFLPKGSPGICSVREIKADVRHFEVAAEGGRVFCSGEVDLLVEYLSFAPGKQYPGYESYEQQLDGGGSMWQALLTVPFELDGAGDMPCPPLAELAAGEINWFMVSTHALEMEIGLCLSWQVEAGETGEKSAAAPQREPADWRQVTLAEVEHQHERQHNLNTNQMKTKEECLTMEHDDKIMRVGVPDQGWQITSQEEEQQLAQAAIPQPIEPEQCPPKPCQQETSILAAAIEEIAENKTVAEQTAAEEQVIKEVMEVVEEVIEYIEELVAEEQPVISASPLLNIQTVETPWQPPSAAPAATEQPIVPMQAERPITRSRAVGLPRLHMRHEQIRRSSYQVNIPIDDK